MRRKVSEESYRDMLKEAWNLFWNDIKRFKTGILIAACYLSIMELVLHNGCIFVVATGFPCPGCGLTRAGLHVLKGEWFLAAQVNFFIFPIGILAFCAVLLRYFLKRSLKGLFKYVIALVIAMVLYYLYRMATQFPGKPPMTYYYNNWLLRFLRVFGI